MQELSELTGHEIGRSVWFPITQDTINAFADVTQDHQYIHLDPEASAKSPFGGTIAHGFLSLSLLSAMFEQTGIDIKDQHMGVNYGFNHIRFPAPVKCGGRVRGVFAVQEVEERNPGHWQMILEVKVEIEGEDKPAVVAEWVVACFDGS